MTWWFELANLMQHLLDEHALPTAFVLLFLEEAGLPPIVPGDFLMMLVGMRAAEGRLPLVWGTIVLELATILGGSILYWVSRWSGSLVWSRRPMPSYAYWVVPSSGAMVCSSRPRSS